MVMAVMLVMVWCGRKMDAHTSVAADGNCVVVAAAVANYFVAPSD
jgi:hypothetical protein